MIRQFDLFEHLKHVQKPGRYLGGEWNEVRKDPGKVKSKIALAFPDLYEVGMSYLGQKILYFILNSKASILAERVFAPWTDFEQMLRSKKIPLFSLENKIPLFLFDIVGFSLLYELNYTNILTILELGQIPFISSERSLDHPLVIAGGPAVFNPEPVADIFDLFMLGDGEEAFLEIIEKYMLLRDEMTDKEEVLKELSRIKSVYVPSLYHPYRPRKSCLLAVKPKRNVPAQIEKRLLLSFPKSSFPEKIIVPNIKVIFDRVAIEVARGCPQNCRFCQATSIYFPPRAKNPDFVMKKIFNSLRLTGYEDASLAALSISDYPYLNETIEALMQEFEKQKISLALSSLRPKGLTSDVAENILRVRKTGFTLVPEAGTERLRHVINKNLKDDDILEASLNAFSHRWKLLKLYFMVGLPTEREEDLEGIIELIREVIKMGHRILKKSPQINLSVSSFIPKPHTPFQWLEMEDEMALREKHKYLKLKLRKYPFVRLKVHPLENSILEAVFSRGDRRLTPVLFQAWSNGARFDSWNDRFDFAIWKEAFEFEKIDYKRYLSVLERETTLPWDHISTGLKKSYLLQELDKALKGEQTASCIEKKCGECEGCSLWPVYEKRFSKKWRVPSWDNSFIGEITNDIFRYRVFYSKLKPARFFSHIDLNAMIQRSFRRAGISAVSSEGFHPKMLISFPPALPLGMEGIDEVFEFKSKYLFSEDEFISRINRFLPPGVKFMRLDRLNADAPVLNDEIDTLVYSLGLKNKEIRSAIRLYRREKNSSGIEDRQILLEQIDDYLKRVRDEPIAKIDFDEKFEKLFLYLKFSPQRIARPQEIVERIFRISNPVFLMAREKILLKKRADSGIHHSKDRNQNRVG